MKKLIMIDDDPFYLKEYESFLKDDYKIITTNDLVHGIELIQKFKPVILLLDIAIKNEIDGLEILPFMKKKFNWLHIIMVTNYDSYNLSQKAQKYGAADYFVKSSNLASLKSIIKNVLLKYENNFSIKEGIVIESNEMKAVYSKAKNISKYDNSILIVGESGSGKEILAKFIHKNSERKTEAFIPVNCGAISENLIESELFGFVKGAFTGAVSEKKGLIEEADKGTLFLDEIEDLSLHAQVALLRVLQEKKLKRIGSNKTIKVDFRIITASKNDLRIYFDNNKFRSDLYYRIAGYTFYLPPLREREKEILPMAYHFMHSICDKYKIKEKIFSQEVIKLLQTYEWPGNIRELKNVIESAVLNCKNNEIRNSDIGLKFVFNKEKAVLNYKIAKKQVLQDFEKNYLYNALVKNKWNITKASKEMGITRRYLHELLKKYNLDE